MVEKENLHLKVEAILFSYGDWLLVEKLQQVLGVKSKLQVEGAIKKLDEKFKENSSFELLKDEVRGVKFSLRSEYEKLVEVLISEIEIPQKTLKILSMVALEQPVTKTRLAEILGNSVVSELNYLRKNKFIDYEKRGIGKYYKVTKKFYDYFQLEEKEFKENIEKNLKNSIEEPSLNVEEKNS